MLLNVIVELAVAALTLQLNLLFNVAQVLHDSFNLQAPLKRIDTGFEDLVFLGFLEQELLFLVSVRIEEAYLGLFDLASSDLSSQV